MTAPLDQAGMRERHTQIGAGTGLQYVSVCGYCQQCGDPWPCDAIQALDALGEAERAGSAASKVLVRLGLMRHAGTWITREEADRISKDGP